MEVTSNICGVMKNVNSECITCKQVFQLDSANNVAPTSLPIAPIIPAVPQIPMPQPTPPVDSYTMTFENNKVLEVFMYSPSKIVALFKDENGNRLNSEEFNNIVSFKETVKLLKEQISKELAQIEEYKNTFLELGFEKLTQE